MMQLLKDMKKIKEDAKTVEMAHPSGHSLTIILKKVPAIQREALKRLPLYEGGDVKGIHKSYFEEPETKKQMGESKAGDKVRSMDINKKSKEEAKVEHHKVLGEMKEMPNPKLKGLANGGMANYDEGSKDGPVSTDDQKPPVTVNVNAGPTSAAGQQATAPVNVQQPNIPTSNPAVQLPNGSMSAPGAAKTGLQAEQEQRAIDISKAQSMVPVEQAKLEAQRQQAVQDQNNVNALKTHADNLAQNINKIDPDAYRKNMSDPAKVATGLGLFLGGFSVPFGGQNFTADFLNKQIDRDIDAQKQNNENQKTVFGAYNTLYGDQNVASNMAKASMADIYTSQAAQIAQKLGTPQAIANYHKLASDLSVIKNKAILDSAGNLSSLPNNPSKGTSPQEQLPPGAQANPNQKLIDQGLIAGSPSHGMPGADAAIQERSGMIEPDKYADSSILNPGAEKHLDELRYTPKAKDEINQIKEQYNSAVQADALLDQLHDVHQKLYKDALKGGSAGYVRRHDPSASIPLVGEALSRTFVQPATANPVNKEYDSLKSRITGDIAQALRGTNVSGEEINHMVNANVPEPGDPPELVQRKERNIRLFIKNSVNKGLLKDWELAPK
jgi:hypothetical protein